MALPVACIDIRVRDRVAAVDHHSIPHINPHVACAAGVVGALEENQIPRPCVRA